MFRIIITQKVGLIIILMVIFMTISTVGLKEIPYGDYFEHILSFWSHRFDDNFNFLVYEHMKNNPKDAVLKIEGFLGQEFVIKLKENNELLVNKILESSTISAMKDSLGQDFNFAVRKGIVGDWRNHFNKAESDLVDEKVRKLFTGTGLEMLWREEMNWSSKSTKRH